MCDVINRNILFNLKKKAFAAILFESNKYFFIQMNTVKKIISFI